MALREITVPHLPTYNFGVGVDALSGSAMNLAVTANPSPPLQAGGGNQTIEVARVSSTQDLQQKLGINLDASAGCASFGAGISARFNFAKESQVHSASLFMTITSTIHFSDLNIVECVLTQASAGVVDRPDIFRQRYGDMFARACRRGGLFVGLMRVETTDEAEATQIESELRGSYGLLSAAAAGKFTDVTTKHHASVYCSLYAEGGPVLQLLDPTDPKQLLDSANAWLKSMFDDPARYSQPYEWTLAPLTIAEGPMPPNQADIEHAQDVIQFCAQQRATLLDQLNLFDWWIRHQDQYDWSASATPELIAQATNATQKDLDTVAACASKAINSPESASMPADFAATLHTTYPLSQPPPRGPKPWPGVSGLWQHNTLYAGQSYTSQWSLTPIAGRSYAAQEIGLGNATGTAVLNGNILAINWITSAETGTYQWNLDADFTSGVGTLTFTGGARAGTPNCESHVVRVSAGSVHAATRAWRRWTSKAKG